MFCQECGTQVANDVKICPNCGFDFVKKVATDSNQASQSEGLPPLPPPNTQRPAANSRPDPNLIYPKNPPHSVHVCWLGLVPVPIIQMIPYIVFGQISKCFLILAILMCMWFTFILGPFSYLVGLVFAFDAYKVGKTLASGKPVGKWEFFPTPLN